MTSAEPAAKRQRTAELHLTKPTKTKKGTSAVFLRNAPSIDLGAPNVPVRILFPPKQEETSRLSLCAGDLPEGVVEQIQDLESRTRKLLAEDPATYLRKAYTAEQIEQKWLSSVQQNEGHEPMVRFKLSVDVCKIWNLKGVVHAPPSFWRGYKVALKLRPGTV